MEILSSAETAAESLAQQQRPMFFECFLYSISFHPTTLKGTKKETGILE